MALHAKLLKHNILRVSKFKKLSHTTQAIERSFDQNTLLSGAHSRNTTDKTKQNGIAKKESDSLLSLSTSPSSTQTMLPVGMVPDLLTAVYQEKALCQTARPSLKVVAIRNNDSKTNLGVAALPLDCLPIAKQVRCTTDDIISRPAADTSKQLDCGIISFQNDSISVQSKCQSALWQSFCVDRDLPGRGAVKPKDNDSTTAAADSFSAVSVSSKPNTKHRRRHTICDSNPSGSEVQLFDSDRVMCYAGPDIQTFYCSGAEPKGPAGGGGGGPNLDQLRMAEAYFLEALPKFFKTRLDYRWYHPNIILENNFWGENEVSVGINQYAIQMTKLRALTHLKFAHVHMEVVSSACIPEEGVIRIQWRVVGISQLKALRFWRYTAWSYSKSFQEDAEWLSGVSILHINKDGVVVRHRIDRVMPDEDQAAKATTLAAKLALLLGLSAPKTSLSDFSSLLCRR